MEKENPTYTMVKQILEDITKKYSKLSQILEKREDILNAAADFSQQFYNLLNMVQIELQEISDDLDAVAREKVSREELLDVLDVLHARLGDLPPTLEELELLEKKLCCTYLNNSHSKVETSRILMQQVKKKHSHLQATIAEWLAEPERRLVNMAGFESGCDRLQKWLDDSSFILAGTFCISADRNTLRRQLQDNEASVKIALNPKLPKANNEQEPSGGSLGKLLQQIYANWNKVHEETVINRHRRLQTCNELCSKYHALQETFLKWLDRTEEALQRIKPGAVKQSILDSQLKELTSLRNDISMHNAVFGALNLLGEVFLSSCDTDKEGVQKVLAATKQRWLELNAAVLLHAQSLENLSQQLESFSVAESWLGNMEDELRSLEAPLLPGQVRAKLESLHRNILNEKSTFENLADVTHLLCDNTDEDVTILADRFHDVIGRYGSLAERCASLGKSMGDVSSGLELSSKIEDLVVWMRNIDKKLDSFNPLVALKSERKSKQTEEEKGSAGGEELTIRPPSHVSVGVNTTVECLKPPPVQQNSNRIRRYSNSSNTADTDNVEATRHEKFIQEEMKEQVRHCTCCNPFTLRHVVEEQYLYRSGSEEKLLLTRMAGSTVMVRVGGGWEELDKFLAKNDPCRGRKAGDTFWDKMSPSPVKGLGWPTIRMKRSPPSAQSLPSLQALDEQESCSPQGCVPVPRRTPIRIAFGRPLTPTVSRLARRSPSSPAFENRSSTPSQPTKMD